MQSAIPTIVESINLRPQALFKCNLRDNLQDNSLDFYSPEDYNRLKTRIESLDPNKMMNTNSNLKLTAFTIGNSNGSSFKYIDTEEELSKLTQEILKNDTEIGLDIEQTNLDSYQGYNCLIQISCSHGNYIIDTIVLHDILAPYLRRICENEDIVKVFYGGSSDLLWLNRDYGVFVVNYFDVHQACIFYDNKMDCSLVGLFKKFCDYNFDKNLKKSFQVADWRVRPLPQDQLNYAALDSHYLVYLRNLILDKIKKEKEHSKAVAFLKQMQAPCLKMYHVKPFSIEGFSSVFDEKFSVYRKEVKAKKLPEEFVNAKASNFELKRVFITLCRLRDNIARKVDTNPDQVCSTKFLLELQMRLNTEATPKDIIIAIEELSENESSARSYLVNHVEDIRDIIAGVALIDELELTQKIREGKEKVDQVQAKLARKKIIEDMAKNKNIYEDCRLVAPDGELLCYVSRKKIEWYQAKGIGTLIEPTVVRLNFEPSNRGYSDMRDLNIDRKLYVGYNRPNQCVICGQKEKLSRYHVVPILYRQYFPLEMKAHRGHDVLLICERCLEKANKESLKFRDELAKRYDVPVHAFEKPQVIKSDLESIKKALKSLERHTAMPKESRRKLKQDIREMYDRIKVEDDFTDEFKEQMKKFKENKEQKVKLDVEFMSYFKGLKNPKDVMKNFSSGKEFRSIHGKLVLEKLQGHEGIKQFVEEWRMFFVDALDPQFLPYDWHLALKKRFNEKNGS